MNTNLTPANKLSDRAMLVSLSISTWAGRKLDKKVTQEVSDKHGTTENAGRYTKRLIPQEAKSFESVLSAAAAARLTHYAQTLPWSDNGTRILPAKNFMAYAELMRAHKEQFEQALYQFIAEYPTLAQEARKALNGLYNSNDYPSAEQLKERFKFATHVLPLPDASDFRVELDAEQTEEIKKEITAHVEASVKEAQRDNWTRLQEALAKMRERLNQPEGIFRDSLFGNLAELCDLLPRLNLLDDPKLEAVTQEIKQAILAHGPQEVRGNKTTRAQVASKVESIQASMASYFV